MRSRAGVFRWGPLSILLALPTGCGLFSPSHSQPQGPGWTVEAVARGAEVGLHSSIQVDAAGRVHLGWYEARNTAIGYGRRESTGTWQVSRLDPIGWLGRYPYLVAMGTDTLHLTYQDVWNESLRHAFSTDGGHSWRYEYVAPPRVGGSGPRLFALNDQLCIIDYEGSINRFVSHRGSFGSWITGNIFTVNNPRMPYAAAAGPNGFAAAVFSASSQRSDPAGLGTVRLLLSNAEGTLWTGSDVVSGQIPPASLALEWDDAGTLHLLYRLPDGRLLDRGNGVVDRGVGAGTVRLHRSPDETLWALYPLGNGLGLARWASPGGPWQRIGGLEYVYAGGRWDMTVAGDGSIHVSVYSDRHRTLWYARRDGEP